MGRDHPDSRRPMVGAAVAVLAALALAGCGDSSTDSTTDTTTASTAAAPTTTAAPTPAHYQRGRGRARALGELDPAYAACSEGRMQSPIDIVDPGPSGTVSPSVSYTSGTADVINNGHTIQANAPSGMSINLDGTDYGLLQVHFHSPGEHALGGASGPVELHFVHRSDASVLAVLGFVAQAGADNAAWQPFVDALGTEEGEHTAIQLDWPGLVPASITTIRYPGSLTTPPCTEGVQWLVVRDPLVLGQAQIDAFAKAFSGNNRPLQALNDRMPNVDSPSA